MTERIAPYVGRMDTPTRYGLLTGKPALAALLGHPGDNGRAVAAFYASVIHHHHHPR